MPAAPAPPSAGATGRGTRRIPARAGSRRAERQRRGHLGVLGLQRAHQALAPLGFLALDLFGRADLDLAHHRATSYFTRPSMAVNSSKASRLYS